MNTHNKITSQRTVILVLVIAVAALAVNSISLNFQIAENMRLSETADTSITQLIIKRTPNYSN